MLPAGTPPTGRATHGASAVTHVAVTGGIVPVRVVGEGAPVILLHGWTLDHRMWAPQAESLARDHRLVMPDRRGCGHATAPPDLAQEADDVIAIADHLGLARFALLGLSRGATAALDVARQYPSRVSRLVVSGAPLPALVPRAEVIELERYQALAAAGDLAQFRAQWAQHPLMQTHAPEAATLAATMLADYDGRDLIAPGHTPDLARGALAALPMPVLALAGEFDTPWRRACAAALAATAPSARHGLIARAGHLANLDNPAVFNAAIAAFLQPRT